MITARMVCNHHEVLRMNEKPEKSAELQPPHSTVQVRSHFSTYLWCCSTDFQCQHLAPQAPRQSTRIHNPPCRRLPVSPTKVDNVQVSQ